VDSGSGEYRGPESSLPRREVGSRLQADRPYDSAMLKRGGVLGLSVLLSLLLTLPVAAGAAMHASSKHAHHSDKHLKRHKKRGRRRRRHTTTAIPSGLPTLPRGAPPVAPATAAAQPSLTAPAPVDGLAPPIPVDGPTCAAWRISLPCRCPPPGSNASVSIPAGDGLVEVTLQYPDEAPVSCPGGIAIENASDEGIVSLGYETGPADSSGPGIGSGISSDFALAPGTWTAVGYAGQEATRSVSFLVAAGQRLAVTISLP